jgi:uncharacterized protein
MGMRPDTFAVSAAMTPLDRLHARLATLGPVAVAVSGGVDSLTLATAAHRALGRWASMFHATSPAVPREATDRVRALATAENWSLEILEAEPDRFYSAIAQRTRHQIVSGSHLDDPLYPPVGAFVRHPFVEAGFDKVMIRRLAVTLGLGIVAELPATSHFSQFMAQDALTGALAFDVVQQMERLVVARLSPRTVRFYVRGMNGVRCLVVSLDAPTLALLDAHDAAQLQTALQELACGSGIHSIAFTAHPAGYDGPA